MRHSGPGIPKAQLPSLILMTKMHQVVLPLFGDGRLNVSRSLKSRKSRNTKRCCCTDSFERRFWSWMLRIRSRRRRAGGRRWEAELDGVEFPLT